MPGRISMRFQSKKQRESRLSWIKIRLSLESMKPSFWMQEAAEVAHELAEHGIRVLVAGLDTDFRGEPFGPMPILMSKAERVDKSHAICMVSW